MSVIVYQPVLGPTEGNKGNHFCVNGAIGPDRDEAIQKASSHSLVKSGQAEIKRVDEIKMSEHEWFKKQKI